MLEVDGWDEIFHKKLQFQLQEIVGVLLSNVSHFSVEKTKCFISTSDDCLQYRVSKLVLKIDGISLLFSLENVRVVHHKNDPKIFFAFEEYMSSFLATQGLARLIRGKVPGDKKKSECEKLQVVYC